MSKKIVYGFFVLFFITACGSSKDIDQKPQISSTDYPYIETFHKGVRLKATGRVEEAIAEFKKCLVIRQDDDAVYYALSQLELKRDNEPEAANYILQAAELDPKNIWYTQDLAYMYFKRQDFPKAVKQFEVLVANEPRNIEWQYGYAESLLKSGDVPGAIGALNKTQDQVGLNPQLSIQKYELYMEIEKPKEALNELLVAREIYVKDAQLIATLVDHYFDAGENEKAVEMLEALVIADPENGRAHLALADVYRREGDKAKSYVALNKAFKASDVTVDNKMRILMTINESGAAIDPEVYELVDIMVEQYPTSAKAHSIHGDFLLGANKNNEALAAYKKALKYDENQFPIWKQVLIMQYQSGANESLYIDSKECLELFPTSTTVYILNGVAANQTKRYEEAIDILSVGYELIINDVPMQAEFCGQLGDAYFGIKDYSEAKKFYQKGLKLDTRSLLLKNNFALRLAIASIDLELAESLIIQATDAAAEQSDFIDTYGFVLFQKGEYEAAKSKFENAYELADQDESILEHLGDVEFKLGSIENAIDWWNKAKAIKSNEQLEKKIKDKKYYGPE